MVVSRKETMKSKSHLKKMRTQTTQKKKKQKVYKTTQIQKLQNRPK